jgi:hypothetical protein
MMGLSLLFTGLFSGCADLDMGFWLYPHGQGRVVVEVGVNSLLASTNPEAVVNMENELRRGLCTGSRIVTRCNVQQYQRSGEVAVVGTVDVSNIYQMESALDNNVSVRRNSDGTVAFEFEFEVEEGLDPDALEFMTGEYCTITLHTGRVISTNGYLDSNGATAWSFPMSTVFAGNFRSVLRATVRL